MFLELEKKQFVERQAFFDAVKKGEIPGDSGGKPADPAGPSFPPAHTADVGLSNARAGYGEEGIRGGRIVKDFALTSRKKRLPDALAAGAALGVPADMMEFGFLLGKPEFSDGKDVPDPDDPNPTTPSFWGAFPYLSNFSGKDLTTYLTEYWAQIASGGKPSGGKA